MPARIDDVEIIGRDDLVIVQIPGHHLPTVVAPQEIALAVAIEVAGRDDVPIVGDGAEISRSDNLAVVHVPSDDLAVVIAPQDVALAVAVEIAGPGDVPI